MIVTNVGFITGITPRPEICTLRKVFAEVYAEREKLIKAL